MWDNWVVDAKMGWPFCFCPVEGNLESGEYSIVFGMNVVAPKPPYGKIVGIVHADGQAAVNEFCEKYRKELDDLISS